jgi:magnesium transporter
VFIPMIISTGGNSGSQASTLMIRAMALGEVRAADWWLVLRREVGLGFLLGAGLGLVAAMVGGVRVAVFGGSGSFAEAALPIGAICGLSVIGCVMCGTLAGAMLPFILRRFGADPASASAPFVATLVDVSGILIYFAVANLILAAMLL